MITTIILTQTEIDLIRTWRRERTVISVLGGSQFTLTPIEVSLIRALRSMPQVNPARAALSQTETDLIYAARRAQRAKAELAQPGSDDSLLTLSLLAAISYIVDGLSVGYIQHVMDEGGRTFANKTRFTKDSAWFQAEVATLPSTADINR